MELANITGPEQRHPVELVELSYLTGPEQRQPVELVELVELSNLTGPERPCGTGGTSGTC